MSERRHMRIAVAGLLAGLWLAASGTQADGFGSDPTRPAPAPGATAPAQQERPVQVPTVSMIQTRIAGRRAFIDGEWRQEGDRVNGFRVEAIHGSSVELSRQGTIRTISVAGGQVERTRR